MIEDRDTCSRVSLFFIKNFKIQEEKQMSKNTALGAEKSKERKITFKNREHEKFYHTYLSKCPSQDTYHKTLIYWMKGR